MYKNKKTKVSITDVARHAGVGVGTVSRVINQTGNVSEKTRRKILQTIHELGYVPNRIAQGLRSNHYKTVMLIADLENPQLNKTIKGVYSQLESKGYMLSVCNIEDSSIVHKLKTIVDHYPIDGIILAPRTDDDAELNEYLRSLDIPIITYRMQIPGIAYGTNIDYSSSVRHALKYLFSLRHRNICLICSSTSIPSNQDMLETYRQTFAEHQIPLDERNIISISNFSPELVEHHLLTLMNRIRNRDITAIICLHKSFFLQMLHSMKANNIRYPDDVSLIAVEDDEFTKLMSPPITVIRRSLIDMGKNMGHLLLQYIENPDLYGSIEPYNIPTEFIIRDSCREL
jgi:LacI family transcriptional regulator